VAVLRTLQYADSVHFFKDGLGFPNAMNANHCDFLIRVPIFTQHKQIKKAKSAFTIKTKRDALKFSIDMRGPIRNKPNRNVK